jgi:putative alpha-1,2-mannosidase
MQKLLFLCLCFFIKQYIIAQSFNAINYVNPFIGTDAHGHTYPGATWPLGMVQLSPDTRLTGWDGCSAYHYTDDTVYGFSHTHLSGTGCSDYGDILLMPTTKEIIPLPNNYKSSFLKAKEIAEAGYYNTYLEKWNVQVELTSTERVGIHQYTFPQNKEKYIVLDLCHRDEVLDSEIEIVYPNKLRGYRTSKAWANNQKVFFDIEFSTPFIDIAFYNNDTLSKKPYHKGKSIRAIFKFADSINTIVTKVAISGVDNNGAALNLEKEASNNSFIYYKQQAQNAWNKKLSLIQPNNNAINKNDLIKFYTALYHCFIQPNIYSDADGRYRGRDNKIYNTKGKFNYYTVFSIWDTYRAWHPLITLLDEKLANDLIVTMLEQYKQVKLLPVWELSSNETNCMPGYHATSVIWDAYSKGILNYDAYLALQACKTMATRNNKDIQSYIKYGYVRVEDDGESVSKTLEFAYDDWCIYQLAQALTNDAVIKLSISRADFIKLNYDSLKLDSNFTTTYNKYIKDSLKVASLWNDVQEYGSRCQNWQNVLDPNTKFMRPIRNGTWYTPFSPYNVDNNYTEANSWQYSFYVPHQLQKLISYFDGKNKFEQRLDSLFNASSNTQGRKQDDITGLIGQYAHGNEPSHHIAYLYNYTNNINKSKSTINNILQNLYTTKADGLCGNEDCGQMSAWYVMSQLGIYPIAPGSGFFEFDNKAFSQWKINTNNAKYIWVNIAVKNDKLFYNKEDFTKAILPTFCPNPTIKKADASFENKQIIELQCIEPNATIWYMINNKDTLQYNSPFTINTFCDLKFWATYNTISSKIQHAKFYLQNADFDINLTTAPNKNYAGGGKKALINGIIGNTNWKEGSWVGYQNNNLEVELINTNNKKINTITINFLEDQNSWIFYPTEVCISVSTDGKTFEQIECKKIKFIKNMEATNITTLNFNLPANKSIKHLRLFAKNYGKLPEWHQGFGDDAFIFADEIIIK